LNAKEFIAKIIVYFRKKREVIEVIDELSKDKVITTKVPINLVDIQPYWIPPIWYQSFKVKQYSFLKIKRGWITEDGVVYNADELVKASLVYESFETRFNRDYLFKKIGVYHIKRQKNIVLIWNHWGKDNYYHWMMDSLSNLILIQKEIKGMKVLLPPNPPQFVVESLKSFNIETLKFSNGKVLDVKELIYPIYPLSSGNVDPILLAKLRHHFLHYIEQQEFKNQVVYDKVYVSRSRQKKRFIVNEKELIHRLEEKGFKVIYFEDYTFWEQLHLMKHAQVLVAPHGANMVNMLVMQENSKVIEVNQEDVSNATLCYWSMASNLGFEYYYVPVEYSNEHYKLNQEAFNLIDKYC
jgi:hypothetical protein